MSLKNLLRQVLLPVMLVVLLVPVCNLANAAVLHNLYSIDYDVADDSSATRTEILPMAMEQMILKVSSSKAILSHPELASAKNNIDKYVNSYSYQEKDGSYKLSIQFDEKMVVQLLHSLGKTTLGKNRPQTLVWLTDMGMEHAELQTKLDILAKNYGIPMIVPPLDLPDIDLRPEQVQELAKRHRADLVLKGAMKNIEGDKQYSWLLLDNKEDSNWSSNGPNIDDQLELMINTLAPKVISRYGQSDATKNKHNHVITVRILGINNMQDYAKVSMHLNNLAQVKKVAINSVLEDEVTFLLTTDSDTKTIAGALSLDQTLITDTINVSEDDKHIFCRANL